jgi:hypothetical protein
LQNAGRGCTGAARRNFGKDQDRNRRRRQLPLVAGPGHPFYRDTPADGPPVPGFMHPELGGYRIGDIEVVAAFDVAEGKVGRDLAEALAAAPNNTARFLDRSEQLVRGRIPQFFSIK